MWFRVQRDADELCLAGINVWVTESSWLPINWPQPTLAPLPQHGTPIVDGLYKRPS
jgi:hypothetical protein